MARPTPDILAQAGQGDVDAMAAAMGPQVMALNISAVRLDGGTQPRAGINQAVVEDYASDEANGAEFPPVQVVYDGAEYWLWDGFHRLHARKRNGLYTVPAIVRQGTRRDAVLLSVGANATHGFRRTNEDKRRAVMALLEDEEWGQWSDSEIARRCAVSHPFVGKLRAELSCNGYRMETRRVERNGVEYDMKLPERSAAPAVASQDANYATPDELTNALREWSGAFEDAKAALSGLLADFRALGSGDYKSDWGEWMDRRWYHQDLLVCLGELLGGGVDGMDEGMDEIEHALRDKLLDWAGGGDGALALMELMAEMAQRNFPYMGVQVRWKAWRQWHEVEYPGVVAPAIMDVRDALRGIVGPPQPEPRPEASVSSSGPPERGRAMEFEKKQINQGKTIKIFGRNMDGTLTVTVDTEKLHLYSPGVTMTPEDAYYLTVRMQRALGEMHLAKQKETNHA